MKCANCGNNDNRMLWDEGDAIYCSRCGHRTQKGTDADDLITCPYCGRMTDRKSYYCMWCNNHPEINLPDDIPSDDEFSELDTLLKTFEKTLKPKDVRYWNVFKKNRK